MSNYVEDFMAKLARQTAPMQRKSFSGNKSAIEKISLAFNGNWGRYQVLPINSVLYDYPYVTLFGTREVCIPRRSVAEDGTESVNYVWVKIMPKCGFIMKDKTGRVVSSLTSDEEKLLSSAQELFDELFTEVDARNDINMLRSLVRKRNYTIFHAFCTNRWEYDGNRAPIRQNFGALFVCTAKGFVQAIEDSINEESLLSGGDNSFLSQIYNNDLTRTGFMMFSISQAKGGAAGFSISIAHKGNVQPSTITLAPEDLERMKDPIENFMGWQANKEDINNNVPVGERRLFNTTLMNEVVHFMAQQLAAVRNAKATGGDINEAIKNTNELLAKTAPSFRSASTNDPVLRNQTQAATPQVNPEVVAAQNTQPYQTPPAGHFNPISGAPVNSGAGMNTNPVSAQPAGNAGFGTGGFKKPDFANFGSGSSEDLPF